MRLAPGIFGVVLTAVLQGVPAFAQIPCPVCRAQYPFGDCDSATMGNPPNGAISIIGTVAKVDPVQCGSDVTLDVKHASKPSVPARIRIQVRPCFVWVGKTGHDIHVMVAQAPSNGGAYEARRCN